MGAVALTGTDVVVTTMDGASFAALGVDVGNPHAVSFTDDLGSLPLYVEPSWEPRAAFPDGVDRES